MKDDEKDETPITLDDKDATAALIAVLCAVGVAALFFLANL